MMRCTEEALRNGVDVTREKVEPEPSFLRFHHNAKLLFGMRCQSVKISLTPHLNHTDVAFYVCQLMGIVPIEVPVVVFRDSIAKVFAGVHINGGKFVFNIVKKNIASFLVVNIRCQQFRNKYRHSPFKIHQPPLKEC